MSYSKPLSYSGISLYKKCPKQFASAYVSGVRTEAGPAAQRGTLLHEELEKFFIGTPYPKDHKVLSPWRRFMEALTLEEPTPEAKLAVLSDWTPTSFDDPSAELRGAADLISRRDDTVIIRDWKSGKRYDTHKNQGEYYVAMAEDAERYVVEFVYLDMPTEVDAFTYCAAERDDLRGTIEETIKLVRTDEEYPPTPSNDACRWCPLSWRNAGVCKDAP